MAQTGDQGDDMDKVMIVTGASRGIGAATARLAAQRGYAVAVNYNHSRRAAEEIAEEIVAGGGRAIAVGGDVAQESDVLRLFETVDRQLGRLTALVNNAGILAAAARLADYTVERIDSILGINVRGTMLCSREAVRRMSSRHGGAGGVIVNVSSVAARLGGAGEFLDYATSKGAIDTFTVGLANEVAGEGIRVNAVSPGIILTDIHASAGEPGRPQRMASAVPMQRPGTAAEVAQAILWLCSEEASYVTGANLTVSGGR